MIGFQDLAAICISGAFVFGVILALLGSIRVPLARHLDVDEARVGGLLSGLNLAMIPMMLLSGLLIDAWGIRLTLILGALITSAALALPAFRKSYQAAFVAMLLVGMGSAWISVATILLMPKAFFGAKHLSASLNLGNVFFGLGVLVMPPLADFLLRTLDLKKVLLIVAACCLLPALFAILTPGRDFELEEAQQGDLSRVMGEPMLWLAAAIFFLYGPMEWSMGAWLTTYLAEHSWRRSRATLLLSGFWLAFLGSRVAFAFLQKDDILPERTDPWVVTGLSVIAAMAIGHLVGSSSDANVAPTVLLVGLAFGPIFPTLVGSVFRAFPHERGTAYGAMFAVGSLGGLVVPILIARSTRRGPVQQALRWPTVFCLIMAAAGTLFGLLLHD
jgi:fucose permease